MYSKPSLSKKPSQVLAENVCCIYLGYYFICVKKDLSRFFVLFYLQLLSVNDY